MENLINLVHSNNILTRPMGVNIQRKVSRERNTRLNVLLAILWFDSIYTASLAFIPTDREEMLMEMADLAFMIFNKNRYFFFSVVLFYRISSAAMVTCFVRDDFTWIVEASAIFERLKTPQLWITLTRLKRRCQTVVVGVVLGRVAVIVSAHTMGAIINHQRDAKYFLVHSYLYTGYYAIMYSCVNFQFMVELYFLCQICTAMFEEINLKFSRELILFRQYSRFPLYHSQFSEACVFVNKVMSYVRPTYIIYFVCNLIVNIFLFYVAIYESENTISSVLFLTFALGETSVIVFFSSVIGAIDVKAKQISDMVYHLYIINAYNPYAKHYRTKMQAYFHSIWCSTIGLEILGNHINATSSIRILTIVLTVMAFLISNFRQS